MDVAGYGWIETHHHNPRISKIPPQMPQKEKGMLDTTLEDILQEITSGNTKTYSGDLKYN